MAKDLQQLQGRLADLEKENRELRGSEARFRILFEYAPDAYYISDLKGNFIDGNRAAEEMTGYKKEELIGKSFLRLKLLPSFLIPKAASLLALNVLGKPTGPDEMVLNRKDGGKIHVEVRTFPIKMGGKTLVLGIARDITGRRRTERGRRDSTTGLIHEEKLSVLGEMTAAIAHDLKQPLNSSKIIAQSLLRDFNGDQLDAETAKGDLLELIDDIDKMAYIIDHMRTYSRRIEGTSMESVSVNTIVSTALKMLESQFDVAKINLKTDLQENIPTIKGDAVRLEQAFLNLINNAKQAVEEVQRDNPKIEIKTYAIEDSSFLAVEIIDNGNGIADDERERIFERFYTTKKAGIGTGLGLTISRKIISEHNGQIELKSLVGKGTVFRVILPIFIEIP